MNARILLTAIFFFMAGCSDSGDDSGFAGLAESVPSPSDNGGFLQPGPDVGISLPEDFGPHPRYRVEWWYLTANLVTPSGAPLGLQWTQFRQGFRPRDPAEAPEPGSWSLDAAWMAHAAVSWRDRHWFAERLARADTGAAGAEAQPLDVWLDDWELKAVSGTTWQLNVRSHKPAAAFRYDLTLTLRGKPVLHGQNGFSAKSDSGEGSMYFSLVDIDIRGTVTIEDNTIPVTGQGWFDREWSSQFLKRGQQGWDWFALHLDSGDKLMAFRLRGEGQTFVSGTWIPEEGSPQALGNEDLSLAILDSRDGYPVRWHIEVPGHNLDLQVAAPPGRYVNEGHFPYWESPVQVEGNRTGFGYMELTGYASGDTP